MLQDNLILILKTAKEQNASDENIRKVINAYLNKTINLEIATKCFQDTDTSDIDILINYLDKNKDNINSKILPLVKSLTRCDNSKINNIIISKNYEEINFLIDVYNDLSNNLNQSLIANPPYFDSQYFSFQVLINTKIKISIRKIFLNIVKYPQIYYNNYLTHALYNFITKLDIKYALFLTHIFSYNDIHLKSTPEYNAGKQFIKYLTFNASSTPKEQMYALIKIANQNDINIFDVNNLTDDKILELVHDYCHNKLNSEDLLNALNRFILFSPPSQFPDLKH